MENKTFDGHKPRPVRFWLFLFLILLFYLHAVVYLHKWFAANILSWAFVTLLYLHFTDFDFK